MVTRGRSLSNERVEPLSAVMVEIGQWMESGIKIHHHHHIYYNDIHYLTHVNTDKYIYTHIYTLIHK